MVKSWADLWNVTWILHLLLNTFIGFFLIQFDDFFLHLETKLVLWIELKLYFSFPVNLTFLHRSKVDWYQIPNFSASHDDFYRMWSCSATLKKESGRDKSKRTSLDFRPYFTILWKIFKAEFYGFPQKKPHSHTLSKRSRPFWIFNQRTLNKIESFANPKILVLFGS